MLGRGDYEDAVSAAYREAGTAWLTPGELFAPYYARALARHMLRTLPAGEMLHIVELGGGTGTVARGILDAVLELAPDVYAGMTYVGVEASEHLARRQTETVGEQHSDRFRSELRDATSGWGSLDERGVVVLACELLDNLPHDRVVRGPPGDPWQETWIEEGASGPTECLRPAEDSLVMRCLMAWEATEAARVDRWSSRARALRARLLGGPPVFLPTTAMRMLDSLAVARPKARLILCDFNSLPDVRMAGFNAPLVASQPGGGTTKDYASYLDCPRGGADVFFPTDFELLDRLAGGSGRVMASGAFLQGSLTAGELRECTTASGYSPLLSEFPNTSIYTRGD